VLAEDQLSTLTFRIPSDAMKTEDNQLYRSDQTEPSASMKSKDEVSLRGKERIN